MKNIADLITEAADVNAERIGLQKQVDKLAEREKDLLATIHAAMSQAHLNTASGTSGFGVKLVDQVKPVVSDWDQVRQFIRETGNFSLLHARLTESAVKELQSVGVSVPGVVMAHLEVPKLFKL